ncbi:N-acetyltransferase [Aerococcaceae bacterium DSM 111021]|nr:N-acetyltransferase [Aerococcaceae bacterium DSM 111021]
MEFKREGNAIVYRDESNKMLAEITFPPSSSNDQVVIADHTYTDPSLRGQGIAGKLVDELVSTMDKEGKKIKATCPYVVRKFRDEPEKYDFINADK